MTQKRLFTMPSETFQTVFNSFDFIMVQLETTSD